MNQVDNFEEETNNLLQHLVANRNQYFPNRLSAARICRELTKGRPNRRMKMNRRKLLRFSVARSVRITDNRVISRATDLFMKTATHPEKVQYKILAEQVNAIINN
ncbi:hypothetical protein RclHR1_03870007 [Rhizophagus clarus]|uniref:Uncharacterized protein n=1 Tax=Rhizophagus clarus TaxID=94130 RepID=A0A2Z6S7W3_9GLOM|nr:hypothetical protein RclHR1_03870007 [Rhizophagus clarus]GET02037.1 hypothetical protein GLOIN_2v1767629 [Rhizophagus clarus]